jgi:hypothetical protein
MKMREFYAKIAGVTHGQGDVDPQALLRHCKPGQHLQLIRDPHNQYDKNAIKVCLPTGEQLGWIDKGMAERLAEDIDHGVGVTAAISAVTGGCFLSGKSRGCNIKVRLE